MDRPRIGLLAVPNLALSVQQDLSPPRTGFLSVTRKRYAVRQPDGTTGSRFTYDSVHRVAIDAVVMAAHFRRAGVHHVYLRTALRVPLTERGEERLPELAVPPAGTLWELPAGLIEPNEPGLAGARLTAARELKEELGFDCPAEAFRQLGPSTFPAPGIIGERHLYYEVVVDPVERREPQLDGSPLEAAGMICTIPLDDALAACRSGEIADAKTEIGLRRLKERLS